MTREDLAMLDPKDYFNSFNFRVKINGSNFSEKLIDALKKWNKIHEDSKNRLERDHNEYNLGFCEITEYIHENISLKISNQEDPKIFLLSELNKLMSLREDLLKVNNSKSYGQIDSMSFVISEIELIIKD